VPSLDVLPPVELSECRAPQTAIRSAGDLARFTKHSTYKLFLAFLMNLNHAIKGCGNSSDCHVSQVRERRASAACTSTARPTPSRSICAMGHIRIPSD